MSALWHVLLRTFDALFFLASADGRGRLVRFLFPSLPTFAYCKGRGKRFYLFRENHYRQPDKFADQLPRPVSWQASVCTPTFSSA